MRTFIWLVVSIGVAALLLAVPGGAAAGIAEPEPAMGDDAADPRDVVEIQSEIDVRVGGSVAQVRLRRTLQNPHGSPIEAMLPIRLPKGGAVTGFRCGPPGRLASGEVGDADGQRQRYFELRRPGDAAPSPIALAAWDERGVVMVRAFPLFPGDPFVIELDVTVPLTYVGGRLRLWLPRPEAHERPPRISASAGRDADLRVASPFLDLGSEDLEVSVAPGAIGTWAGRSATLALAKDRHLVRIEAEIAPQLGIVPKDARFVFVVDRSWSEGDVGIDAQLQLVRGILASVPDAHFEVVLFDRVAERLVGGFAAASDVDRVLAAAAQGGALRPRNGSDPTAGLALAQALLRGTKQPGRLVFMSDAEFARATTAAAVDAALARLPAQVVVHAVRRGPDTGPLAEARDAIPELDAAVARFGGQILAITGASRDLTMLAAVCLGLVRPIRIDDVALGDWRYRAGEDGDDGEDDGLDVGGAAAELASLFVPETLAEGEGVRAMAIFGAAPRGLVLTGRIWGREVTLPLGADKALTSHLPALVVGDEVADSLTDGELGSLGLVVGLLTKMTSFLVAAPGAEPSTLGYDEGAGSIMIGCSGGGTSCGCCGVHVGVAMNIQHLRTVLLSLAEAGLSACAARAATGRITGTLAVEYTGDEVVGVHAQGLGSADARCVGEVAWALRLTKDFHGHAEITVDLDVGPAGSPAGTIDPAAPSPASAVTQPLLL
jgi:hypothetical protein